MLMFRDLDVYLKFPKIILSKSNKILKIGMPISKILNNENFCLTLEKEFSGGFDEEALKEFSEALF